jgi:hypothetical protein
MITITHEGGNCKAVLANGSVQYWVTANADYSSDGDNVTVTKDGVEVFTADIADITIDGEDAYGTAADVIEQIQATDVQSKILQQVSGDLGGGSSSYLVYTALLTQSGTDAPVATVLQNTLGGTVVWTRFGEGIYIGTLAGAFAAAKTFVIAQQANSGNSLGIDVGNDSVDAIYLNTFNIGTEAFADGQLINTPVEIRVYP